MAHGQGRPVGKGNKGGAAKRVGKEKRYVLGVAEGRVRQVRALKGTWRAFGAGSREEFERLNISDEQVAEYLNRRVGMEEGDGESIGYGTLMAGEGEVAAMEAKVAEKEKRYGEWYEILSPNDEETIRILADMEVRIERVQELQKRFLGKNVSKMGMAIVSDMRQQEVDWTTQYRMLQQALGIDRRTRDERRAAKRSQEQLEEVVVEAAKWMEEQLVGVVHCGIELAWLWCGFPQRRMMVRMVCPRCGAVCWWDERGVMVAVGEAEARLGDDGWWKEKGELGPVGGGGALVGDGVLMIEGEKVVEAG